MATYKTPRSLSDVDAAYIAGLIDGEGTVTLCRKHKNENRQLAISISNTEKELLHYVLKVVDAGKITAKRTSRPNHTPSYTYAIYNRQALNLLRQVHPYLKSYKAQRSKRILEDYLRLTPRNGKYSAEARQARFDFERDILNIKATNSRSE